MRGKQGTLAFGLKKVDQEFRIDIVGDKERVKDRWAERFANVLNRDRFTKKDIE
jgi:hypothetical protein